MGGGGAFFACSLCVPFVGMWWGGVEGACLVGGLVVRMQVCGDGMRWVGLGGAVVVVVVVVWYLWGGGGGLV